VDHGDENDEIPGVDHRDANELDDDETETDHENNPVT
jgi:hypothetical protein